MFKAIEALIKALEAALVKEASKASSKIVQCSQDIESLYQRIHEVEELRAEEARRKAKAEKLLGRVQSLTAE